MCVGRPKRPQVQGLTAEEKAEQEQAKEREKQAREEAEAQERRERARTREERLEKTVKQERRGTGATSLLTGGRGGMGYFDETL
jgi:septal ring factor EnvC (AmiA/AmiB activator)